MAGETNLTRRGRKEGKISHQF